MQFNVFVLYNTRNNLVLKHSASENTENKVKKDFME